MQQHNSQDQSVFQQNQVKIQNFIDQCNKHNVDNPVSFMHKPNSKNKHRSFNLFNLQSSLLMNYKADKQSQSIEQYESVQVPTNSIQLSYSKNKSFKLNRYSLFQKNETKPEAPSKINIQQQNKSTMESQIKKHREKVSLLKRIIEHYNIKSMENTFYSNLINNIGGGLNMNGKFYDGEKTINIQSNQKKEFINRAYKQPNIKTKSCVPAHRSIQIKDGIFRQSIIKVKATSIKPIEKSSRQQQKSKKNEQKSKLDDDQNQFCQKKNLRAIRQSRKMNLIKSKMLNQENYSRTIESRIQQKFTEKKLVVYDNMDNAVNIKINKYKQFLFIVNLSNNVYRDFEFEKYQNPFKIYVGSGNNSNLIKAIMKKRFWFELTKNKDEANFLWTQLKEDKIFQKQNNIFNRKNQKIIKKSILNKRRSQLQQVDMSHTVECNSHNKQQQTSSNYVQSSEIYQQQMNRTEKNFRKQKNKNFRQLKYLKSHKNIEVNNILKILNVQQTNSYIEILNQYAHKKHLLFYDRVKYNQNIKLIHKKQFHPEVIHNHFAFNGLLGNKKAMFYMLKQYYKLTNKDLYQTVPLTFHIKKGFTDEQFKQFLMKYNYNRDNKLLNYWVMKPGQFSNRGQGIACTNNILDVKSRIENIKKLGNNKSLILQQYITSPLLYNGRKFDIRTYMLISTNNAKLRAYWYQEGYIRTSSYIWKLEQITDSQIHLTNDAIQKYCSDYGKYEPGNKLTYTQLQRYLDTLPKIGKSKDYNFHKFIYPRLKQIATDAVKSSFKYLDPQRKANNFEIFGFDFMIDANFNPWLIEINTNPCLQTSCPVLQRIIPSMVQNAFRIALDPIFPPPMNYSSTFKYNIPENALFYNKFQLIFDQQKDGPLLLQLYKNSTVVESIDDYEEDKEVFEEEGQEIIFQDK